MATEEKKTDDVEKVLADIKAIEGRKQAVIDDLLKQKIATLKELDDKRSAVEKEFAEKLAKLGYRESSAKKRSHHKRGAGPASADTKAKPKG